MKTLICATLTALFLTLYTSMASAEKPTAIPEDAIAAMERLVGTWKVSVTDDNEKRLTRRVACWWTRGKTALHRSAVEQIGETTVFSTCVIGWESDTNTLVARSFLSDGRSGTVRYPVEDFLRDTCEGEVSVVFGDDNRMEGKCVLKWTEGGFEWTGSLSAPDGTTRTRKSIVRRVAPPTEEQAKRIARTYSGQFTHTWTDADGNAETWDVVRETVADGAAMVTRFTNEKGTAVEYTGWLPASRYMISTGRGPLGDSWDLRFFEITDERVRGSISGTTEEGDEFHGMLLIKLHGPDRYTMKRDLSIDGEWHSWTGEVRRKK